MENYPPTPQSREPAQPAATGHGFRIGIGIAIGCFVIVLGCLGACVACGGLMAGFGSRESRRVDQPGPIAPGSLWQRVERAGIALTAGPVERVKSIGRFQTAGANNVYLVVEVLIENIDRNDAPYNPFYFKLKDSSGIEYSSSFTSVEASLSSGTLYKGDKVRGKVTFEIRQSASGLILSYEPLVIFGGYDPIRIGID